MSQKPRASRSAILLTHCPDQKGLVAIVTDFLYQNNGNVLYLDQHVDRENKRFFMRVEWDLDGFAIPAEKIGDYFETLIAHKHGMTWELSFSDNVPRMAIFVSKIPHCLYDLLARCHSEEWNVQIPLVVSNHPDLELVAKAFGVDFHHVPVVGGDKAAAERRHQELLESYKVDFIVLARYMQVVSADFIQRYPNRIINIHHSFLPAFAGAKPYHAAHERGVKIIGATSHYVTAELDAGPIIEQDVARVTHRDQVEDLIRKGKDLEKLVLSRAVWLHLNRRVHPYNNRTVVFN